MFGLTLDKLFLIGVLALFLIGPEKLPYYASQLGRLIKQLRSFADTAKGRLRDDMGPDFDEVDWKKLDPRQYDPRRIIREALSDEPGYVPLPAQTDLTVPAQSAGLKKGEAA